MGLWETISPQVLHNQQAITAVRMDTKAKEKEKGKRKNIKSSNNQPVQGKVIYETNWITEKKHYNEQN